MVPVGIQAVKRKAGINVNSANNKPYVHYRELILKAAEDIAANKYPGKADLYWLVWCRLAYTTGGSTAGVNCINRNIAADLKTLAQTGELECKAYYSYVEPDFKWTASNSLLLKERKRQEFRLLLTNKVYAPFSKELRETKIELEKECIEKHLLTPEIVRRCMKFNELLPNRHKYKNIFRRVSYCLSENGRTFGKICFGNWKFGVSKQTKITEEQKNALLELCEIDREKFEDTMFDAKDDRTAVKFVVKIILYCFLCGTPLVQRKFVYSLPQKQVTK